MKSAPRPTQGAATLGLLTASGSSAGENIVTPALAGYWEGQAQITVAWCRQRTLPVKVDIHPDGSVTGAVGDAKLVDGRFEQNRGWLGRRLNLETDYIIVGNLEGPIIAGEGIVRERVRIPLDFAGGVFKGGVNTSGSNFGGKARMWLAAMSLQLVRAR